MKAKSEQKKKKEASATGENTLEGQMLVRQKCMCLGSNRFNICSWQIRTSRCGHSGKYHVQEDPLISEPLRSNPSLDL